MAEQTTVIKFSFTTAKRIIKHSHLHECIRQGRFSDFESKNHTHTHDDPPPETMAAKWQTALLFLSPFIRVLIAIFGISFYANRCRREASKMAHATYAEGNSLHSLK